MINSSRLASIGQMAGSIAHEINNPLTIIQGFAFKIKRQLQKELSPEKFIEQYENHFQSINNTIIRISKIISGLRNISRDGANDPMEKTSLENIIQEILSISLQKFKNNNVSLSYEQKNKEIMVSCRHVQIGQVLLNLLNNAYDAVLHTQEAWVKIQVTETDQEVELSITDSGKGIPEDIVEKMLTPFYTSKPVGKGTGLGLSIAKKIIEQHSGVFYYDELSENTRFVIVLPKCEGRELVA